MTRVSSIAVITEGWRDWAFAKGFLAAAGHERSLQPIQNPKGFGCGYAWVRNQFIIETKRLERFSEGRGVLALMDEDGVGASVRQLELEQALSEASLPGISAAQGRCLLLPTRNIETWIYWLRGNCPVDESSNYKHCPPANQAPIQDKECVIAGRNLHRLNHTILPNNCPPMLTQGLGHLRTFLAAVRR